MYAAGEPIPIPLTDRFFMTKGLQIVVNNTDKQPDDFKARVLETMKKQIRKKLKK